MNRLAWGGAGLALGIGATLGALGLGGLGPGRHEAGGRSPSEAPRSEAEPAARTPRAAQRAELASAVESAPDLRALAPVLARRWGRAASRAGEPTAERLAAPLAGLLAGTEDRDRDSHELGARSNPGSWREPARGAAGSVPFEASRADDKRARAKQQSSALSSPASAVTRFLAAQARVDGLELRSATGYWSNSYVPGDPWLRAVSGQVARARRAGALTPLPEDARPGLQPFDSPDRLAVDLRLGADRAALAGTSRVRLQIGLKATERLGGHRPPMNLVLLLHVPVDGRGDADDGLARARALAAALQQAREPGDRFALLVSGRAEGLRVSPGEFRHGPLTVALDRLASTPSAAGRTFEQGLAEAYELARGGDDPSAALGTSHVLAALFGRPQAPIERLETLAHSSALAGTTLSALSLSPGVGSEIVERLALAGQGHRRVLESPAQAPALVERELFASTRAVAHALRLRIRLAAGVRLVEILGSERLDTQRAQRVRAAERSIDARLARNLGIAADRGQDEEGIQIVVPSFFAGDAHVVVLDLLVERPGPIADVRLRYKDLVHARNAEVQASLALPRGERRPGPLERNVSKNVLASHVSEALREAERRVRAGDPSGAAAALGSAHALVVGMREAIEGWESDRELVADATLLAAYLHTLGRREPLLADALALSAHRRLLAPRG